MMIALNKQKQCYADLQLSLDNQGLLTLIIYSKFEKNTKPFLWYVLNKKDKLIRYTRYLMTTFHNFTFMCNTGYLVYNLEIKFL